MDEITGPPSDDFLLRYVGARFHGGRLPVESLSDLPAFRDLLVAFAKDEIRASTGKKKVPNGFENALSLSLTGIYKGSAVPALRWDHDQSDLPRFAPKYAEVVKNSYQKLLKLIDGDGDQETQLGAEHLRALNSLGAGLQEGERIEFVGSTASDGRVVFLDAHRRRSLITKFRDTYHARYSSTGFLTGVVVNGAHEAYIRVDTENFGIITIPVRIERVADEFDGNLFWDVHFDLTVELDGNAKYRSTILVHEVELVDQQVSHDLAVCRKRLEDVSRMRTEMAEQVAPAAVRAAREFLGSRPQHSKLYRIFPTEIGGVLLEVESGLWDVGVEFLADGGVELYAVSLKDQEDIVPKKFAGTNSPFFAAFDSLMGGA